MPLRVAVPATVGAGVRFALAMAAGAGRGSSY
jgi:hypothetical protein